MRNSRNNRSFGGNRGNRSSGRRDDRPREMFKTECDQCHKQCEVPFKPTSGKPIFCNDCFRENKSGGRSDNRDRGNRDRQDRRDRKMYQAVCDSCGDTCEVPFQPNSGKPVYCDSCFGRETGGRGNSENPPDQLKVINEKLDKILKVITNVITVDEVSKPKTVKPAAKQSPVKKVVSKKITKKKPVKKAKPKSVKAKTKK